MGDMGPSRHELAPRPIFKAAMVSLAPSLITLACGGGQMPKELPPVGDVPQPALATAAEATAAAGQPDIVVSPSPIVPAPAEGAGTPEPELNIPFEAKQFLGDLEKIASAKPDVLSSEEIGVLTKAFAERDWPNAKTERQKWSAYRNLYSSLWARYNVTHDAAIKAEMKKIEDFLAITWPDFHPAAVQGGGFLRD